MAVPQGLFFLFMENTTNNIRPTLSDPMEWVIIRSIYFNDNATHLEDIEPIERLERMQSRQRNLNNNSR